MATDDRNAINACKLARIPFTSALAVLVRMYGQHAIGKQDALLKLATLEREGRYRKTIVAEARARLEVG